MRILLFVLLWWAVSDGNGSWAFGIPVILLATVASYWLQPARGAWLRPLALLRLCGFFLYQSVRAGIDVALRALGPGLRLAPGMIEYQLRLPEGIARVLLLDTLSLLPGTLSAELNGDRLCLHVLDTGLPNEAEVRKVESYIAGAFGMRLLQEKVNNE